MAVEWLQVAVDGYCPIGFVVVTLHPQKILKANAMDRIT